MRLSPTNRVVDTAGRLHRQQWLLRSLIPVGVLVVLVLIPVAGGDVHPVLSLVVLLLALVAILAPDSAATLLALAALLGLWFASVPDTTTAWVLAVLPAVVTVHLAATVAAYGPPGMTVEAALVRLWVRRGVLLVAAGWGVWVVARLVATRRPPSSGWLFGLALAVALAWVGFLAARLSERPSGRFARDE